MNYSVPALLFTPICPFSLSFRPLILPEEVEVMFYVSPEAVHTPMVSIDGHTRFELERGESLQVTTSQFPVSCTFGDCFA